jgi:hypothetical protein
MSEVADNHHLVLRNGVWYFRRRVPKPLVRILGKAVIQFSLDTSDKREAKRRREIEDVQWSARFAAQAAQPSATIPGSAAPRFSKAQLLEMVRSYVEQMHERFQSRYAADPPDSPEQKSEIRTDIEIGIQVLERAGDPRGDEIVSLTSKRLLGDALNGTEDEGLPYAVVADLVRRALLEVDRRKLAHVADDHRHPFFDHLFDPVRQPQITFGVLATQFLDWRLAEAAANDVGKKFIDKLTAHVALICEIVGPDTPVAAVDFDVCQNVRTILARTPSNRTKVFGKLPLQDAIQRAAADGHPTLSAITQQGYLRALTDTLEFAVLKRLIPSNPAKGLSPLRRDTVAPGDKRRSFQPDQIIGFFHSSFYQECADSGPEPFRADKTGWRFWLPLISLFTGARPNEICQLELRDIRQTEQGTCDLAP